MAYQSFNTTVLKKFVLFYSMATCLHLTIKLPYWYLNFGTWHMKNLLFEQKMIKS